MNENIRFEKGLDPRKKMDIGQSAVWKRIADETVWGSPLPWLDPEIHEIEYIEEDFMGHPIMVVKLKSPIMNEEYPYSGISDFPGSFSTLHHSINAALEGVKEKIRKREIRNYGSISFERGQNPKDSMGIGYNEDAIHFLNWVRNDYQFDKSNPDEYYGYLNVGGDHNAGGPAFLDDDLERGYKAFLKDWRRYLRLMRDWRLFVIDPPTYGETIFYDEPEPSYGVHAINEGVNFERGQDPKRAMKVGHQADLKRQASKIDWDWYPDPQELEDEEIIWLKKRHGINVKVARLSDASNYNSGEEQYKNDIYYAVSDSGEPFMSDPTFYSDPEEAWEYEKKFLDEFEQGL